MGPEGQPATFLGHSRGQVGRAEVGEYGYATAYASVLIVLMVLAVALIRALVGTRQVLRRQAAAS